MFYLSLYYPNSQIVFHQIALTLGVGTGNILYLLSMILGGGICHLISKKLYYFQNIIQKHPSFRETKRYLPAAARRTLKGDYLP